MSNERHLEIDNGTMGSLFRRATLAALGLDALDDVSEQSFEVIDRADAFAERLLGGMAGVMPKAGFERFGAGTTQLVDHIFEGMVGLNGPQSATDLGEWQYWLDATLLMLFDEDEDEIENGAEASKPSAAMKTARTARAAATASAVRERILALKNSGIRPAMIQALPQTKKREFLKKLQESVKSGSTAKSDGTAKSEAAESRIGNFSSEIIAKTMLDTIETASKEIGRSVSFDSVFAQNSKQIFASHVADKASNLTVAAGSGTESQIRRWTQAVTQFGRETGSDMTTLRTMFDSLDSLVESGAVSEQQSAEIRRSCRTFAKRVLADEVTHDVSIIAGRFEQIAGVIASAKSPKLNAQRALSVTDSDHYAETADAIRRSFAVLGSRLDVFNEAVAKRVLSEGESAATIRWQRASDRFVRMQGISDDVDRVLLRDVVESAAALGNAGIVTPEIVSHIVKSASSQNALARNAVIQNTRTENAYVQNTSAANASGMINVAFAADSAAESMIAAPRVISGLADRVEKSVESLVGEMVSLGNAGSVNAGGMNAESMNEFITAIRGLASKGRNIASDPMSIVRASSVIEAICEKLDNFAESAANSAVTLGYDDLTSESGIFVSAEDSQKAETVLNGHGSDSHDAASVRAVQAMLERTSGKALEEAKSAAVRQIEEKSAELGAMKENVLSAVQSANDVRALIEAHKSVAALLTAEEHASIEKAIESAARSASHLESVSRSARVIENAAKLSASLRSAVQSGIADRQKKSVVVGDARINPAYFTTLGETLESYGKIRDSYETRTAGASRVGMSDSRIEKMLSTVKPSMNAAVNNSMSAEDIENTAVSFMTDSGTVLGYDEIIPASMEWVRSQAARYPSNDNVGDLTAILGAEKAVGHHAASVASGNPASAEALGRAIAKMAASGDLHRNAVTSYGMTDDGERVKVALTIDNAPKSTDGYELRNKTGMAYMPETARTSSDAARISAKFDMTREDGTISGAEDFVPLIAGANHTENSMNRIESMTTERVNAAAYDNDSRSLVSGRANTQAIMAGIAGRLGIHAPSAEIADRLQLSAGGVNFDMSSDAYIEMLAKPVVNSAAFAAPGLTNAQNILFSGYASLLSGQSDRRTLKSLRRAYMESLAKAGTHSAHGDLGFNTHTFSGIMGTEVPAEHNAPHYGTSAVENRTWAASDHSPKSSAAAASLNDTVISRTEPVVSSSASNSMDLSWVSNALGVQAKNYSKSKASQSAQSDGEHQILTKIDTMLDYVENMSQRDVGVFSSDETVRVLLEALPESGKLGNKGLPKWRQKDTRASRAAEARELRDALARIGASPIQGTQAFANKQFVSPNLISGSQAAPLFSGGSDSGTAPSGGAFASDSGSNVLESPSIPQEDLQTLAEDVFQKIVESFNEELQRRRSE